MGRVVDESSNEATGRPDGSPADRALSSLEMGLLLRPRRYAVMLQGTDVEVTEILARLGGHLDLPFVEVQCQPHDDYRRLCMRFLAAHEQVFGPTEARWDRSYRRAEEVLQVGEFYLLIRDPDRLTPKAAKLFHGWAKHEHAGLKILVGEHADEVFKKDPVYLGNYVTVHYLHRPDSDPGA